MIQRGELMVRIEEWNTDRWAINGRWTLYNEEGAEIYASDVWLGYAPSKEDALRVAGLFSGASAGVAEQLTSRKGQIALEGSQGLYSVRAVADLQTARYQDARAAAYMSIMGQRALERIADRQGCQKGRL